MTTLVKFDGQVHRFVIPKDLVGEQREAFVRTAAEIENTHLEDVNFYEGSRYLEVASNVTEAVLKALKNLCELCGYSAYYARDVDKWLFAIVC